MRRTLVGKNDGVGASKLFQLKERGGRLGLIFADGRRKSLPYLQLIETEYNPDMAAIILDFVGHRVTVYGRNLIHLYEGIEDEEVGEITERHVNDVGLEESLPYITRITFERV